MITSFEELPHPGQTATAPRFILGSKLFHPSVILARLSSLSQRVTVAFYGAGVWSVTEANGLVLFCKLDLC
jgi:hypothetical protein